MQASFPNAKTVSMALSEYAPTKGDVEIGNDVWIGNNATIMSGVHSTGAD
jgi:acetyltransferase-like isoleucine patch superfamily enzyme